jgi:hypothetical protein
MKKLLTNYLVLLTMLSSAACQPLRTVKVTVAGDDKKPIEEAKVMVGFIAYQFEKDNVSEGMTDENGVFEASGNPPLRMMVRINKEGYYETEKDRLSKERDHDLSLILREKKNPIPLIARKVREKIPGIGKEYGYDFEIGDWVTPFGKGKQTDLILKVSIIENQEKEIGGQLELTFPDENEGVAIIDEKNGYLPLSDMKMPNLAILNSYQTNIERIEFGYQNHNKPINTSYFFRTRQKINEDGEQTYHYTKFLDGISFTMGGGRFLKEPSRSKYPVEYGAIDFIYYFNPHRNDRNLEFDTSENIVKALKTWDQINEP